MSMLEPGQNNAPGQQMGDPANLFGNNTPGGSGKWDKPLTPTPPDYKSLIDEQGKQGRINQTTPWGSLQYTTDPKTGQVSANYTMDPQEAALSGKLLGNAGSILNQTKGGYQPGNFGQQVGADEQNSFNQAMALMNPQLKMQQDQLNQSMADRGLPIGSEIQNNSQNEFDQYRGGLENQAAYNAIGMGQQEQAQGFNEGLQGYNTNMASLGSLFNMSNSLPGLNNFFAPSGVDVNGAAGISSNAAQQNYANQMQQYGSNMGGLSTLGAAFMMSDRRKKHDIRRVGITESGIPLYVFRYNGSNDISVGVMADEAKKIIPDAVITGIDGFDRVNYERIH